jgi:hypothetical protein
VLGWGRKVGDTQAIHGEKMIYRELSRGKPVLAAVQRARHEMQKEFIEMRQKSPDRAQPAWSLLRLYSDGTPLGPIVKEEQHQQPKSRQITRVNLLNSRIKVMGEGFVGRRRQLQISLRALNRNNYDKVGVLLLGSGGLGKSCLAGKISERFPGHMVIALHGKLDAISLGAALRKIFHITADKKGLSILARKTGMTERLAYLCAASFKEKNYILLLDGFQQNLEEGESGYPGLLRPEAAALLDTLLQCLPIAVKMTHLVITSRYSFTLTEEDRDLVEERLQKIWLTSFRDSEVYRKICELKNIYGHESPLMREQLKSAGCGNPLLLEKLDRLAGQIPADETGRLQEEIEKMREDFIGEWGLYELYRQCSESLKRILKELSIYPNPVTEHQIPHIEEVTGITGVKCFLREGMNLSLAEHDQANRTYRLTPLMREILK